MASTMTTYVTSLRLTNAQARKILALAKATDMSMAQWLRKAVAEKLERETQNTAALAAHAVMQDGAK